MRNALALALALAACEVPEVAAVDGIDHAEMVLAAHGYLVVESAQLPVVGLTDCVDKLIWIRPEVNRDAVLVHEAVHVLQVAELGCTRFLARYVAHKAEFEYPAYVSQYRQLECDDPTIEAFFPDFTDEICE